MRCMPTRLWKPTAGTGLANSVQACGRRGEAEGGTGGGAGINDDTLADLHGSRLAAAQHRERQGGEPRPPLQGLVAVERLHQTGELDHVSCPA